jgi:hypothetical protein
VPQGLPPEGGVRGCRLGLAARRKAFDGCRQACGESGRCPRTLARGSAGRDGGRGHQHLRRSPGNVREGRRSTWVRSESRPGSLGGRRKYSRRGPTALGPLRDRLSSGPALGSAWRDRTGEVLSGLAGVRVASRPWDADWAEFGRAKNRGCWAASGSKGRNGTVPHSTRSKTRTSIRYVVLPRSSAKPEA